MAVARHCCSLLGLLLLVLMLGEATAEDWRTGRATWYDDAAWMSVHDGTCMYGYLGGRYGGESNWHVAAMNVGNPLYAGSCGKCMEVRCKPMTFKDGYGTEIHRESDCLNTDPIIVAMTDSCPCEKPGNEYSNKRWCCSDMDHLDIGVWAFRSFADPGKGVVGIEYRPVDCPENYKDNGCSHPDDPACKGSFSGAPADTSSSQDAASDSGDDGNTAPPYADDTYGQDSSGEDADTADSSGYSGDSSDGSGQDSSSDSGDNTDGSGQDGGDNSGDKTYESGQDGSGAYNSGQDGKYYDDNSDNAYGDSAQQEYSSGGDSGSTPYDSANEDTYPDRSRWYGN